MNYQVFILPDNNTQCIEKKRISEKVESIKNRDFRIFSNTIRSDISNIIFKPNCILIKLSYISLILFKKKAYFFVFNCKDSREFIKYIKRHVNENKLILENISFELFIFESLLYYLSYKTDNYLEKSFKYLSNFTINNFNTNQLKDILEFQHSILIEKNKCQEYYESLILLKENDININYFDKNDDAILNKITITDKTNIIDILNNYLNQIKEDIKNLDRLNNEINNFVELINVKLSKIRINYANKSFHLSIINSAFSYSCFFTFIFGVNIKNGLEDKIYVFYILMLFTIIINIPIYFIIKKCFKF